MDKWQQISIVKNKPHVRVISLIDKEENKNKNLQAKILADDTSWASPQNSSGLQHFEDKLGRAADFRSLEPRTAQETEDLLRKKVCKMCNLNITKPCNNKCVMIYCKECNKRRCNKLCETCLFSKKACGNCTNSLRGCSHCYNAGTFKECLRCGSCIIDDPAGTSTISKIKSLGATVTNEHRILASKTESVATSCFCCKKKR